MKIPVQAFAEIISALRQPTGVGGFDGGAEKRRATRMQVDAAVIITTLCLHRPNRTLRALIRDISQSGVGIVSGVELTPADRVLLQLPRLHGPLLHVLAEVKICRQLADGIWAMGAEFQEEFSAARAPGVVASMDEVQRIQQSILCGS